MFGCLFKQELIDKQKKMMNDLLNHFGISSQGRMHFRKKEYGTNVKPQFLPKEAFEVLMQNASKNQIPWKRHGDNIRFTDLDSEGLDKLIPSQATTTSHFFKQKKSETALCTDGILRYNRKRQELKLHMNCELVPESDEDNCNE